MENSELEKKLGKKSSPIATDERPATLPVRWIFIGVGCDGAHTKFPPTGRF